MKYRLKSIGILIKKTRLVSRPSHLCNGTSILGKTVFFLNIETGPCLPLPCLGIRQGPCLSTERHSQCHGCCRASRGATIPTNRGSDNSADRAARAGKKICMGLALSWWWFYRRWWHCRLRLSLRQLAVQPTTTKLASWQLSVLNVSGVTWGLRGTQLTK